MHKIKIRVYKHSAKESHQIIREENRRREEQIRSRKQPECNETPASTSMCALSRVHSVARFRGKNTGRGYCFLLQRIFRAQGLNPCTFCLLHWQAISLPLRHLGSLKWTRWSNQKTQGACMDFFKSRDSYTCRLQETYSRLKDTHTYTV